MELAFGFTAKLEQVDLLWSLVFDREDRILVAKSIVIVLLPLNALGAEQLADIQRLPLAKPIWLSSKNNNAATYATKNPGWYLHPCLGVTGNRL